MGVFSFMLLFNHVEIPLVFTRIDRWGGIFVLTILVFNLLGYTTLLSSKWIIQRYPLYYTSRNDFIWHYVFIGVLLFVVNYFLLLTLKFLTMPEKLFEIKARGIILLVVIWLIEMMIVSMLTTIFSLRNSLKLLKEKQKLEEDSVHAKFVALQNQLNPHFLFNSLNTLIAEIDYAPETAIKFTQHLSDVYRYILQRQDQMTVALKDEIEFLESFLFLHQVRLGDCICVEYNLDDNHLDYRVPPLTLQVLAENVIKHNYISTTSPMTITLDMNKENATLIFKNTLCPKKADTISGTGLKNLKERYKLLSGKDVEIHQDEKTFSVIIPLLYE